MAGQPEVEVGGEVVASTDAQVQALYSGHTVTPSQDFAFPYNGALVQFYGGVTAEVEPAMLAALTAAGAPFSTP